MLSGAGLTAEVITATLNAKYVLADSDDDATIFQAIINVEKGLWKTAIPKTPPRSTR
jgi:hypothetical protein